MNELKKDISDALKECIAHPGEGHNLKIMPYSLIEKGYQLLANVIAPNGKGGQDQVIIIANKKTSRKIPPFCFQKIFKI